MIVTKSAVPIHQLDDIETSIPKPVLEVSSVWNRDYYVELRFADSKYVVSKDDLIKAIVRSTE